MEQVNSSDFLVSTGLDEVFRIRFENKSLYHIEKPFPDIAFADFRDNELYIKVINVLKLTFVNLNRKFMKILLYQMVVVFQWINF